MRPLAAMFVAALAAAVLAAPAAANPWLERRPLNIAHQGGEHEAPSDTLYAFKRAAALGADVLEMDLHMTKDGHVVVMHDETVDRTTNGSGSVENMTLAQVKGLDAAYWFVPGPGTTHSAPASDYLFRGVATGQRPPPDGYAPNDFTIPTLREVLEEFPDVLINLELKPTTRMTGRLEPAVARLLAEFRRVDDVIVVSFLDHSLELFKAVAPRVHTATATGQAAAFWASSQGAAPGLPNPRHVALQVPTDFNGIHVLHDSFIADAHANDLAVHVWTINDEKTMRDLLAAGADGIMTDRPTMLERLLRESATARSASAPATRARPSPR
jgi:glycerophosphoryl diester phosphodiesterase